MTCREVEQRLTDYLDGRSPARANGVAAHLAACNPCRRHTEELRAVSSAISRLPQASPPGYVRTSLQVMISREVPRRRRLTNLAEGSRFLFAMLSLKFHNALRPLALPCVGGTLAAAMLFASFLPAVSAPFRDLKDDVPTALSSTATVKATAPFVYTEHAVMVELLIDGHGRVANVWFDKKQPFSNDATEMAIKNTLLFTQFRPATVFGQPTSGRIRVIFESNFINVIG